MLVKFGKMGYLEEWTILEIHSMVERGNVYNESTINRKKYTRYGCG